MCISLSLFYQFVCLSRRTKWRTFDQKLTWLGTNMYYGEVFGYCNISPWTLTLGAILVYFYRDIFPKLLVTNWHITWYEYVSRRPLEVFTRWVHFSSTLKLTENYPQLKTTEHNYFDVTCLEYVLWCICTSDYRPITFDLDFDLTS